MTWLTRLSLAPAAVLVLVLAVAVKLVVGALTCKVALIRHVL